MPRSHTGLQKPSLMCLSDSVTTPKTVFSTAFSHVATMPFDLPVFPIFAHMVTLTFKLSEMLNTTPIRLFQQ